MSHAAPRRLLECTEQDDSAFAQAVLSGLAARQPVIPARYFYDSAGSALFEEITRLPEYYPTATETGLLTAHAHHIGELVGQGRAVIEFGAGSAAKTPVLLRHVAASAYVPIDISGEFLHQSARQLANAHPGLCVLPVVGDFTAPILLPDAVVKRRLLGFFPGSTIGNLSHMGAAELLRAFRATLGPDGWLVIGIDTRKEEAILRAAYDDPSGVTAAFNLNLLHRINRELRGTIPVDRFEHAIEWNEPLGRVEMYLRATDDVTFSVLGHAFRLARGTRIHTENSHKYADAEARLLARVSGWEPVALFTDPAHLFGLHVWRAAAAALEP